MTRIPLVSIVFDAGTQIRAAISEDVVAQYAERMSEGVVFPAVVLFHDGNQYYMADGFHRGMASQRIGFIEIDADVRPGTKTDALWFALGANKANAHRMTQADRQHALTLAVTTWPELSAATLAEQMGCNESTVLRSKAQVRQMQDLPVRVTGKDGKSYPASRANPHDKREEITRRVQAGESYAEIRAGVGGASPNLIADVRKSMGVPVIDKSKSGIQQRRERLKTMAAEGHSSRQMAVDLGISEEGCRRILRDEGIEVPGDLAVKGTRRHDSTRIVDHIVMDAENLTGEVGLIDFDDLDLSRLKGWIDSLVRSRKQLSDFISSLQKEQKKHGEAA